jgi:uncharacterized protein (DUF2062 family)
VQSKKSGAKTGSGPKTNSCIQSSEKPGVKPGLKPGLKPEDRNRRLLRLWYLRMFPRKQPKHPVALSVSLGIFIGVLPTIGIAIFLTFAVCRLLKIPAMPGVMASFIAIPPTQFFVFYPLAYWFGKQVVQPEPIQFDFVEKISVLNLSNMQEIISWLWQNSHLHVLSFLLGIVTLALVLSISSYLLAYYIMHLKKQQYTR